MLRSQGSRSRELAPCAVTTNKPTDGIVARVGLELTSPPRSSPRPLHCTRGNHLQNQLGTRRALGPIVTLVRLSYSHLSGLSQTPPPPRRYSDLLEHAIGLPVSELLFNPHHLWAQSDSIPGHFATTPCLGFRKADDVYLVSVRYEGLPVVEFAMTNSGFVQAVRSFQF